MIFLYVFTLKAQPFKCCIINHCVFFVVTPKETYCNIDAVLVFSGEENFFRVPYVLDKNLHNKEKNKLQSNIQTVANYCKTVVS